MASKSERESQSDRSQSERSQSDRAALPFEPKRKQAKDGKASSGKVSSDGAKASRAEKKSKKARAKDSDRKEASTVSAKAQARVDDIRAANRKQAEKIREESAKNSGPDSDGSIPKHVSRRMVRRMAILSISPIAVGVSIFFLSYYLLSNEIVTFAPVVVLLTTMGCFGLGVLGLTYGMLSASWDDEPGSLVGLEQFKLNFGRLMDARRASKT